MADPFSDDFDPDAYDTPETEEEITPVSDQNYVTAILKGGKGYGAPSVSIRGANIRDVHGQFKAYPEELDDLLEITAALGKKYATLVDGPGDSSGSRPRNDEPQVHPEGKEEFCKHGKMNYKEGVAGPKAKNPGKPYRMFVCSGDVPRDQQCRPKDA